MAAQNDAFVAMTRHANTQFLRVDKNSPRAKNVLFHVAEDVKDFLLRKLVTTTIEEILSLPCRRATQLERVWLLVEVYERILRIGGLAQDKHAS